MTTPRAFSELFKEFRLRTNQTLRQFCIENQFDPGNISKIERGVFAAPHSEDKLREYAAALKLQEGSDDWIEFFDAAVVSNGTLGVNKIANQEILKRLPNLFRTLENKELTPEQLDKLVEMIKRS